MNDRLGMDHDFDPMGRKSVRYVDVENSNNINVSPIAAGDSHNEGNNTNWIFPVSGMLLEADALTPIAGRTIALSVDGGAVVATAVTDADGAFFINPGVVASGQIFTLFVSGDAMVKAVTVDLSDGLNLNGMNKKIC